ncbi:hypothetical protein XELAEV_18006856mg [Xenopus laevis]|uniref:Uncharacterized protein n=1 Tax=Xenopus laevis TaxID=8355 RepID=A0A974I458_XENLA|nr:hypothetical protein XELAEV_18006856mg [Xenopus laevis]
MIMLGHQAVRDTVTRLFCRIVIKFLLISVKFAFIPPSTPATECPAVTCLCHLLVLLMLLLVSINAK